jgi:crotonobetainyl-CoA:carnitine CoA-transferase CaiB-like acyl-CoA transferase
MCDASGYPGGDPTRGGMIYLDPLAGAYATAGALAGLEFRARTGRGAYIDNSMFEAGVASFPEGVLAAAAGIAYPSRIGNAHPVHAPHGIYPCAGDDQWVAIAVDSDVAWGAFAEAVGHAEWATDEGLATAAGRKAAEPALDSRIAEATRGRDKWEVARALQAAGVKAAPVLDARETVLDPHLWARGMVQLVDHRGFGRRAWTRQFPGLISGADLSIPRPAPSLGEHNDEILGGELGVSEEELAKLRAASVIGERPLGQQGEPMHLDVTKLQQYRGLREYDPQKNERISAMAEETGTGQG